MQEQQRVAVGLGNGTRIPGAGHFGHKTFRHQDTSAPTLSRITGGSVSCRNCTWRKVSRLFVDLMSRTTFFLVQKCLEAVLKCLMRVQSVLVPKCLVAKVSGNRLSLLLLTHTPERSSEQREDLRGDVQRTSNERSCLPKMSIRA